MSKKKDKRKKKKNKTVIRDNESHLKRKPRVGQLNTQKQYKHYIIVKTKHL